MEGILICRPAGTFKEIKAKMIQITLCFPIGRYKINDTLRIYDYLLIGQYIGRSITESMIMGLKKRQEVLGASRDF